MRTLVRWTLVTLGVVALVRWLRSRTGGTAATFEPLSAPSGDGVDPAEELRRKLAESRTGEDETAGPETVAGSVEARRAEVHALGRSAASEMASPDEG